MIKIAALVFDIYDDSTGQIARTLPGELHEVKVAAHEAVEDLHDHQFGLVMKTASGMRRRYPLDTEDAVKLSRAYFDSVKESLHPEIVKVAEAKFTNPDTNEVAYIDVTTLAPEVVKVAFSTKVFGLTIDGRECFPLHDATLAKTAVARYPATMVDLDPIERFTYARNIVKQATALGVRLPTDSPIFLYTGDELNLHSLRHAIEQRKEACGAKMSTEVLDQLSNAAGCLIKQGMVETDESFKHRQKLASRQRPLAVDKVISVLSTFDKLAGFDSQHYLRGMLDPFAACFKQAGYDGNNTTVDGIDLAAVTPELLNEKFDPEFINEFKQNPVGVYQSSPDPIKSVIREMASSARNMGGAECCDHDSVGVGQGDPQDQLAPRLANPFGY